MQRASVPPGPGSGRRVRAMMAYRPGTRRSPKGLAQLTLACFGAGAAAAQSVQGRVVELGHEEPIAGGLPRWVPKGRRAASWSCGACARVPGSPARGGCAHPRRCARRAARACDSSDGWRREAGSPPSAPRMAPWIRSPRPSCSANPGKLGGVGNGSPTRTAAMTLSHLLPTLVCVAVAAATAAAQGRSPAPSYEQIGALVQGGLDALARGGTAAYLDGTTRAFAIAPRVPPVAYHHARAYALAGRSDSALALLARLAAEGAVVVYEAATDSAFDRLRQSPRWRDVTASIEASRRPISTSTTAFELPERDLL